MKDGSIISAEYTGSASTSFYENDDTKSNFCYTFLILYAFCTSIIKFFGIKVTNLFLQMKF